MSWFLVPTGRQDYDYFNRQRELLPHWLHMFDDSWQGLGLEDSTRRFERELDRVKDELHRMDVQPIMMDDDFNPFIVDPNGKHKFSLRFNCSQFKPEEIQVKTEDNVLKVHAKHEKEDKGRKFYQEFTRQYRLPEIVDPNKLKSHLTNDGVLQIEAEVPPPKKEVKADIMIPIEHLESKKKPEAVKK